MSGYWKECINLEHRPIRENVIYEQPLNQRVRNFLRLEHLFSIANHHSQQESHWDSRATITCLFGILDLISRSDIKNDLIKELERYIESLDELKQQSSIHIHKLSSLLNQIETCLNTLRDNNLKLGQQLKDNELTASIKQRISIPGGTCSFDLPAFHHWLNKPISRRYEDLMVWGSDLFAVYNSLAIVLFILRNSTVPTIESAKAGFYQKTIQSKLFCQLVRIIIPLDCYYFPEVSGGQHRFAIRFMESYERESRPAQIKKNIEFELHCCIA